MIRIIEYVERLGTGISTAIILILFMLLVVSVYLIEALSTFSNHSSLREFFAYGTYEVVAEKDSTNERQVFIVKSMNKISAIEKVGKKIDDTNGFTFKLNKSKTNRAV